MFRRWLRQPTSDFGSGLVHDPLRTKIFFLDVLTNTQAKRFVNDALDAIRNQLNLLERDGENNAEEESRTACFAARNAILITQARITWLEEVLQAMDDS